FDTLRLGEGTIIEKDFFGIIKDVGRTINVVSAGGAVGKFIGSSAAMWDTVRTVPQACANGLCSWETALRALRINGELTQGLWVAWEDLAKAAQGQFPGGPVRTSFSNLIPAVESFGQRVTRLGTPASEEKMFEIAGNQLDGFNSISISVDWKNGLHR